MSLTISVCDIVKQSSSELLGKHDSWERVQLVFIATVINGFAFNSSNFNKNKGKPLIRIRDISRSVTEAKYNGPYERIYLIEPGDLLVGMDGDFNCALWNGPIGLLNQRVCKIEVQQEYFSKRFLSYVLPGYLKAINDVTSSMTVKHLSSKSIEEIPLPLPPLPEQHRIVAAIEQQFTRLDNAIASLLSAQARIKQYRASLLKSAVEGELTKAWRAEHPASETGEQLLKRILSERRARWEEEELAKMREKGIVPKDDQWKQKYKEPQGPDTTNLPELPEGWCWATVEQVAQIQGGIQKQPKRIPRQNVYPYLRVANVLRGKLDLSAIENMELFGDELETFRLNKDDLLIVEGNGSKTEIGRSALWNGEIKDCVHQNHIIRIRLKHIIPNYVDFYWNSPEGNRRVMNVAASTTGLYTLSVSKISQLPIPLPPLAEQVQIVAEVEASLTNIAKLEETTDNNLKRAEHERQSILREAFAGRLVEQDPEDEPASILLERIREERKKRELAEKVVRGSRKGAGMGATKRSRGGKVREGTALYSALVEAGGELPPEELYKRTDELRKEKPEEEHVEGFYLELDKEVTAKRIEEVRPTLNTVLLRALEQEDEALEEEDEALEEIEEDKEAGSDEIRFAGDVEHQRSLWDE